MSQHDRLALNAALTLRAQRQSIADVRSSIAAVLSGGEPLDGRDTPEAFRAAWSLAPGAEQWASGVSALTRAYRDTAAALWRASVPAVALATPAFAAGKPAELLARHDELLAALDAQLSALEGRLREHTMTGPGNGPRDLRLVPQPTAERPLTAQLESASSRVAAS